MWRLDLTMTHQQTWLFSSSSTHHSTDLLTARGVSHLVVHGTSGSTSNETIPPVRLETSGGALSTVDLVVQRCDGPRRLRDYDDDDDDITFCQACSSVAYPAVIRLLLLSASPAVLLPASQHHHLWLVLIHMV